ncbi:class I SAM-dependent methyltransferase [Candidatus Saccharibacteria bacterium]|nr:class I SAM-dependent methyltransferase [Candidatus Saccharibacteria bacterium]
MLVNRELYDPIERTREMKKTEFTKYIRIRDQAAAEGRQTDPNVVGRIMVDFFESHKDVPEEKLAKLWRIVDPKVAKNPGLAQFIVDKNATHSQYFFPWLKSVYTSPSEALEMSYGAGRGLSGEWVYRTDEADPIEDFVRNVPTLVYNRERQLFVADLVTTIQKKGSPYEPTKVVDLGAGRMAWARYHGFQFQPKSQTIYAFDKDPNINPALLFPQSLDAIGLNYHLGDMRSAFTQPECKEADLIMLGGVASYYPMDVFRSAVIMPVYGFLKPGGVFFFDLQLQCPQYEWTVKLFDWPVMELEDSAEAAIAKVEAMRRELWKSGLKFGADYKVDTYNEMASAVMITFTKIL